MFNIWNIEDLFYTILWNNNSGGKNRTSEPHLSDSVSSFHKKKPQGVRTQWTVVMNSQWLDHWHPWRSLHLLSATQEQLLVNAFSAQFPTGPRLEQCYRTCDLSPFCLIRIADVLQVQKDNSFMFYFSWWQMQVLEFIDGCESINVYIDKTDKS